MNFPLQPLKTQLQRVTPGCGKLASGHLDQPGKPLVDIGVQVDGKALVADTFGVLVHDSGRLVELARKGTESPRSCWMSVFDAALTALGFVGVSLGGLHESDESNAGNSANDEANDKVEHGSLLAVVEHRRQAKDRGDHADLTDSEQRRGVGCEQAKGNRSDASKEDGEGIAQGHGLARLEDGGQRLQRLISWVADVAVVELAQPGVADTALAGDGFPVALAGAQQFAQFTVKRDRGFHAL